MIVAPILDEVPLLDLRATTEVPFHRLLVLSPIIPPFLWVMIQISPVLEVLVDAPDGWLKTPPLEDTDEHTIHGVHQLRLRIFTKFEHSVVVFYV